MLLIGDDWAQDHHDVELQDQGGRVLRRVRLPVGVAGIARLHELVGAALEKLGEDPGSARVLVGIETDRGLWVEALIAAGYEVYGINPLQAARYRERRGVSGAKSDTADAHALADMVRADWHQLRRAGGDSPEAEAVKVVARAHKTLVWERQRHVQRLRYALLDYFPAAVDAFEDLASPEALSLLGRAPDPGAAARLTAAQIVGVLKKAGCRKTAERAETIRQALRGPRLVPPEVVVAAHVATTRAQLAVIAVVNEQIAVLEKDVEAFFRAHPDSGVILSQPGLGPILGARVLAEFGDEPARYADAAARKNYAGTSPVTRQSGKSKTVTRRHVHNDRLIDAVCLQAFSSLRRSPGARAYYDRIRARGTGHQAALRQLANRLVGILHHCLEHHVLYDETIAWPATATAPI